MKKVIEIISQIPKYTAYSFSMSMVVFMVISLIVGVESMSTGRLIQLLIICIVAAILQMIAFSDICIKKLAYTKRLVVFMFPFLVVITAFAVKIWMVSNRKYWSMGDIYRYIFDLFYSKYNII